MLNPFYYVTIFPLISEYGFVRMKKKISNFPSFSIALSVNICYIKSAIIFFINVKHCTFQIERSIFRIRNVNAYEDW